LDTLNLTMILASGGIAADHFEFAGYITNSIFVAGIVTTAILLFTRMATRRMELIPGGKQNFVEFVVEFIYGQLEEIVGKKIAPKAFPLLATFFIFILVSNWFGLIPGVGTMGFGETTGLLTLDPAGHFTPLLRPATADLNMTLAMALLFMLLWTGITIWEVGIWGFIKHTFGPKGGLSGIMGFIMAVIFFFVGIIEIVSIVFRPVSLSLRLLGNIYAGETLLHTMGALGEKFGFPLWLDYLSKIVFPLPFYFLEILVGMIQAIVFTLLCAVYIQLSTTHDEEEH
jgi:F-type H+-transporting ATPase subunit a